MAQLILSLEKEKKSKPWKLILILLIVFALIGVVGYFVFEKYKQCGAYDSSPRPCYNQECETKGQTCYGYGIECDTYLGKMCICDIENEVCANNFNHYKQDSNCKSCGINECNMPEAVDGYIQHCS